VEETNLLDKIEKLKEKLNRTTRRMTGLKEKSRLLEMQYEDARSREQNSNTVVGELLERQRELNVMLNRANIMLNRTQEAMALSSMELNEMAKALPEPKKAEWADRVSRVNELFKQTGIQDAELGALGSGLSSTDSFGDSNMKKQSEEAFGARRSVWDSPQRREPPRVQAELVEEEPQPTEPIQLVADENDRQEQPPEDHVDCRMDEQPGDEDPAEQRRRSWWRRFA
jgi:hypothetical protein